MDRRRRKTKNAIFGAFTRLLAKKSYEHITVAEIIEEADVGRTTFYEHFETKDRLLEELAEELFCHILDSAHHDPSHKHIFKCDGTDDVFLHLFNHIESNDNQLRRLLCTQKNPLFLHYFKKGMVSVLSETELSNDLSLPRDFLLNHLSSTFIETLRWWSDNGMTLPAKTIYGYFKKAVQIIV